MIQVKSSGSWASPKKIYVKSSGSWVEPRMVWTKANGVWSRVCQPIPSNMIVLYSASPYYGDLCNGNSGTPNLLDRLVKFSSTALSMGGSATHAGTSHGTCSITLNSSSHILDAGKTSLFANGYAGAASSHSHSTDSHSHGGTTTNINGIYRKEVIPTINNSAIYKNALFLFKNAISNNDWLAFAAKAGYYLYLASGSSERVGSTHSHSGADIPQSSNYTHSATKNYYYNSDPVSWQSVHYHASMTHYLSTSSTFTLSDYRFYNYIYNSDTPIYDLTQLPINTVGLFTSGVLPYGWVRINAADNYFSCLSNNSTVGHTTNGNTTSHSHSATSGGSTWSTATSTLIADNTNNDDAYTVKSHNHTYTDSHTGAVDVTPPWVSLIVAYKNY